MWYRIVYAAGLGIMVGALANAPEVSFLAVGAGSFLFGVGLEGSYGSKG